ncbi:phosphoglycerate kinase, partial [Francisella tularensis subsp. holarctica]|uniref:phosphoglycerate kinase n=1 Tax=Francisella tularensis TaxID=263 RepID=UPI002381CF49
TNRAVLNNPLEKVELRLVGGGIAKTVIKAEGFDVGTSLYEQDLVAEATDILAKAKAFGDNIPVPVDVRVAKEFRENAQAIIKMVSYVVA